MSSSNCCFLTHTQVSQETGKVVWYSHLFKNLLHFVVIHTVKGFSVVNETEVGVFLEHPCLPYDLMNGLNLISGISASWKPKSYIWKILVDILLKPSLKDFEHNLVSIWNECNCTVVWTFFGIALWEWNENWPFPVLWPLLCSVAVLSLSVVSTVYHPSSRPGSFVHGDSPGKSTGVGCHALLQGIFQPWDQTQVSRIAGRFFTSWATRKPENTGVGSLSLLQGNFPTQESNWGLLHCRQILYQLGGHCWVFQICWISSAAL